MIFRTLTAIVIIAYSHAHADMRCIFQTNSLMLFFDVVKITARNSDEELLTISQDGFVMLYAITNSALLIGSRQMQIFLNETNDIQIPANR